MSEKIHLTALEQPRFPDDRPQSVTRFCPKCGREIPMEQRLCAFCENNGNIPRPAPRQKSTVLILSIILIFFVLLAAALFVTRKTGLRL